MTQSPLFLARLQESESGIRSFSESGPASAFPVPSATAVAVRGEEIFSDPRNGELPNLVLVLVESWGLSTDTTLNKALLEPYLLSDVDPKYVVIQGIVPFHGPTIPGEARELCGSGIGFNLLSASSTDLKSCLPSRLSALGYETIAVHGLSGHMFNRSVWYRTIGFRELWFHRQFRQQGLPDCSGAFVGTCDADIATSDWASSYGGQLAP